MNHFYSNLKLVLVALFAFMGMSVWADGVVKTLTFPATGGENVSSYTATWNATVGEDVWTIDGFNTNRNGWTYIKCGRKNNDHTASITSPEIEGATITNVLIGVQQTANVTSATISLINGETVVKEIDITDDFVAGDVDIPVTGASGATAAKLTIASSAASANGTTWITKMEVTATASSQPVIAKPTLPASTTFFGSMTVEISASDGLGIFYTTDGTDPTPNSTAYTGALTISETTTIKAIAVQSTNGAVSAVASATYTAGPVYATLAEANNAATATRVVSQVTLTDALVTFISGSNTYVQDATGGFLIYGTTDLTVGDIVNGTVQGQLYLYNGLPEIANPTLEVNVVSSNNMVKPTVVNAAELAANPLDYVSQYVAVMNASFAEDVATSEKVNINFTVGETSLVVRNNFTVDIDVKAGEAYYVAGLVTVYNDAVQLYPSHAHDVGLMPVTYGTNLDFESSAAVTTGICTYAKDMANNSTTFFGAQPLEGWTVHNVSDNQAPTSGDSRGELDQKAVGVFEYGSAAWLGGKNYYAPEAGPKGSTGSHCLGLISVWGGENAVIKYTQEIQLEAGSYDMEIPVYNGAGTNALAANYIGYIDAEGIEHFAQTTQYPVGEWTEESFIIMLAEPATITVCLGIQNTSGSGAAPHLFIDGVNIVKLEAEAALHLQLANNLYSATIETRDLIIGEGLFMIPLEAHAAYNQAYQEADATAKNESATAEELQAAIDNLAQAIQTLKAAVTLPDPTKKYSFQLKDGGNYMTLDSGTKLAAEPVGLSFVALDNGYAITNGTEYVACTGTGNNVWSMATSSTAYAWTIAPLADGYYSIAKVSTPTQHIGVDNTDAGASCYADKTVSDKSLWAIAEFTTPEPQTDYTDYIVNADLTGEGGFDATGTKGIDGSGIVKAANNAQFDFKQTIENLPAGKYKLTAKAAYRYSGSEEEEAAAIAAGTNTKFATLYATVGSKTTRQPVMNRFDGASETDYANGNGSVTVNNKYVPNSSSAVKAWFDADQYINEVEFNLPETGNVTIGIVKTAQPEVGDYTVIGPWKLERIGDAEEEPVNPVDLQPGDDATSFITNPSFETGDLTGWTVGSSSDTGVKPNTDGTYTTEGIDGNYLFNTWWQGIPITQAVTGLPNGQYELKALMTNDCITAGNQACLYLLANGEHSEAFSAPNSGVFAEGSMTFYVTDGTATIGAIGGNADGSFNDAGYYWYKVDNFRLTYLGNNENEVNYERALNSIESGSAYRIKTDVEGTAYYVKVDGTLTAETNDAGVFKFSKVSGGAAYGFGFHIDGGGTRFTNPNGTNDAALTLGKITTTTGSRVDWEAQVLFKNADGKYAVRATNAGGGDSGWGYVAKTFWTVNEGPLAEYGFDQKYIWELEYAYDAAGVAEHEAAAKLMENWLPTIMAAKGPSTYISNAKDPSEGSYEALLDGDYSTFFHSTWHASNDPQADHYLQAELPEASQEFYFYFKKRQQNNNNRPTTIVVSGSNDGENFTEITTINAGLPTAESVIDYTSAKITGNEAYKYLRFTVPTTNSGNKTGDHVFFTFSEFYIYPADIPEAAAALGIVTEATPTYMLDAANVQAVDAALKAALSTVKVTYALVEAGGTTVQEKTVVQEANSEVNVPADFTNKPYYDYVVEGTIGDTDCTITITRSYKAGLVTALSDLSNTKAYTIGCDRGALLTKDSYLASTAHNTLTDAEPAEFAIIYYDETDDETDNGHYYLYSVADGKFVRNNGSLDNMPTNGTEDAICMTPQGVPYFMCYFTIGGANKGLNTNGNDPYGYVINDWMNADAGNKYFMIATADFDATEAVAALDAYFHPSYFATYVVKDADGNELFKSEPVAVMPGTTITTLPADYQRPFTTYDEVDVTISEPETAIEFTATWVGPFAIAADYDNITWYNMYLNRGEDNCWYLSNGDAAPAFVKNPTQDDLASDAFQWGFMGNQYTGLKIYNKSTGESQTLTKGSAVAMAEGEFAWDLLAKNGEGILIGTEGEYINQAGGDNHTEVGLWYSSTDIGSTFFFVEVAEPVILNAPTWSVADGTQAEPNMLSAATPLLITYTADNVEESGYNPDDLKVKVTVMVSGDLPENMMSMGSQTAHRVMGESFYIPLGEAEFPVALKLGYVYQNIVVTAAQLVANAETDNEEVIASYAGAPVQLHWIGKEEISMVQEMTIISTVGRFYEGLSADAPMADILLALGAESLDGVEIFAVLPDETRDPNYQLGTTDGWRDADGNWKAWADGPDFFIKANFELPSGQIYEAGGYPDKTNEEKTFTAKYVFVKGEAEVTLTVNLVYEPAPTVDIDFSDLAVQGEPIVIEKTSPVGSSYEGFTADVDIASILSTLGVQSLDDVDIFAVQSDESLDPNYGLGTTDGWRNADGDWQGWGADARLCVKADFTTASEQIYYIGGMDGQTSASGSYSAIFAFVKKNSETHEAVVLQVKLTYTASDAQKALEEEITVAEGLIEESQNAELYDQDNAALAAAVATLNDAIDAAKAKLGTTDDEMIAATNALKEAEDAFKSALTAINGINADQLNGTIYDLGGRKIQKVQRGGVYIVNGRKVAIK